MPIDWEKYSSPPSGDKSINWDQYSSPPSEQNTGIMDDLINKLAEAIPEAIQMGAGVLEEIPKSAQMIIKSPVTGTGRAIGKVGAGITEGLKQAYNLPFRLSAYLSRKGVPVFATRLPFASIPYTLGELAEKLEIGDTGLEKKIFGEERPGEALFHGVGEFVTFGIGGAGKTLLERALRAGVAGSALGQNPFATALLGSAVEGAGKKLRKTVDTYKDTREYKRIGEALENATKDMNLSDEQLNALKEALFLKYGKTTPEALERDVLQAQEKQELLKPLTEIPERTLTNLLPPGTGEFEVQAAKQAYQKAIEPIQSMLGKGEEHDVIAAQEFNKAILAKERAIGAGYEELKNDLINKNIILKSARSAQEIMDDLKTAISQSGEGLKSPETMELVKELDRLGKDDVVAADKFLDMYRTIDRNAKKIRASAYDRDITRNEFNERIETAEKLEKRAADMEKTLNEQIGGDAIKKLKSLNKQWATEITPLYYNKIARQARERGRLDVADIMKELRGTGLGQDILNRIVSENPRLLNSIIGQKFAEKPEGLLNLNKTEQRYVNQNPELKEKISALRKALEGIKKAEEKASFLKSEKKRIEEAFKIDKAQQEARAKAIAEYKKLDAEIKQKSKDLENLKEKIKEAKDKKEKTQQLEERKKQLEKQIQESKSKIKKALSTILKLAGIEYGLTKFL